MLYNTDWGTAERASIEEVVLEIEKARDRKFEKDDSNRLTVVRDADDTLGVIVLADRMTSVRKMAESWK